MSSEFDPDQYTKRAATQPSAEEAAARRAEARLVSDILREVRTKLKTLEIAYEEAERENAHLRARIAQIQRKAYSNGSRTFDDCIRDLGEIDDLARAALKDTGHDG